MDRPKRLFLAPPKISFTFIPRVASPGGSSLRLSAAGGRFTSPFVRGGTAESGAGEGHLPYILDLQIFNSRNNEVFSLSHFVHVGNAFMHSAKRQPKIRNG